MGALADLLLLLHLAFVLFVGVGGLLVLRWPRLAWLHLPAVAWGVAVEALGWLCPLTPLEDHLRALAGEAAHRGDFIARTILPVLYPDGLTRLAQIGLATVTLMFNLGIYANVEAPRGNRYQLARYLWALPNTCLGLVLAALALRGGGVRVIDGVLEVHGPVAAWILRRVPIASGAVAITFGHVVAAIDDEVLDATREHERVHVRQYERWGPLFIPAYLVASAWSWLRGGGAYDGNYFERQARRNDIRDTGRC